MSVVLARTGLRWAIFAVFPLLLFPLLPVAPPSPVSREGRQAGRFWADSQRGLRTVIKQPLLILVCGLVALIAMNSTLTEYMYQRVMNDNPVLDIAAFHGQFSAACGMLSLLLQMLVVPRLFPSLGIGPLAVSCPFLMVVGCHCAGRPATRRRHT